MQSVPDENYPTLQINQHDPLKLVDQVLDGIIFADIQLIHVNLVPMVFLPFMDQSDELTDFLKEKGKTLVYQTLDQNLNPNYKKTETLPLFRKCMFLSAKKAEKFMNKYNQRKQSQAKNRLNLQVSIVKLSSGIKDDKELKEEIKNIMEFNNDK
jgi:hypothetical protein